jgi:hypothetical protein
MNEAELREWLGLTPADLRVYIGAAAIVAMYFVRSLVADTVLAVIAIASTLAACPIGMQRDEELSDFTNIVKRIAYPMCVVAAAFFVWLNFARWNS